MNNPILSALLGVAVGDAVGVPYEFKSRAEMKRRPATDMTGFGTYNLPPGTWSDDTSLTLCLADSLTVGYDLADMAEKFVRWRDKAYWTARGDVFDIGRTTSESIAELKSILLKKQPELLRSLKDFASEHDNGNGSLMRIMPLLFYIKGKPIGEQFRIIWDVSSLTHKHIRAAIACLIYLRFAEYLVQKQPKGVAYSQTQSDMRVFFTSHNISLYETQNFDSLIADDIRNLTENEIESAGYVLHSVEASFWCFLKTNSYQEAILKAVNLGHDTDTTAAITGGLAGLYYGVEGIPAEWIAQTARVADIKTLATKLSNVLI